jgi:hypothetical protein
MEPLVTPTCKVGLGVCKLGAIAGRISSGGGAIQAEARRSHKPWYDLLNHMERMDQPLFNGLADLGGYGC